MEFDVFNLLLTFLIFFIYGSICIVSVIFTFSLETYCKIEARLNLDVFSTPVILNPLERNINWVDVWMLEHNKIIGPILTILSLVDLKLWFNLINLI